jgi:6-phosphogluconolactonase
MARAQWLDQVPVPAMHIYSIPAELGAPAGAAFYSGLLAGAQPFDLVLLGLGEDGHTASLFPGQPLQAESEEPALAVYNSPKPPPERVSLSAARLSDARAVWFLVTGEDKRDALQRWQRDEEIPARFICPPGGVDIYTDIDVV